MLFQKYHGARYEKATSVNFNHKYFTCHYSPLAYGQPDPVAAWGQWGSYFPTGYMYTRQYEDNGSTMGKVAVKQETGTGRYDIYHGDSSGVCSSSHHVEEFNVQYCSMTDMDTQSVTYAQFAVYLATHNPTAPSTRFVNEVTTTLNGPAQIFFDENENNVIDSGDIGYVVSCPGEGHPYALHNIDSTPTIMRVWFKQDVSGSGTNYSRRMFWQSLVRNPVNKYNENWGTSGSTKLSIIQSEAFWCADDDDDGCPVEGEWQVGAGSTATLSDGDKWPTGADVQYGRNLWHAKDFAPFWWEDQWAVPRTSNGIDSSSSFSGC